MDRPGVDGKPSFGRFQQGDTSIFEDVCKLQELILMEMEIKQSFFKRYDENYVPTLRRQIQNYAEN